MKELMKDIIFNFIGKKNNQTSVSDADRERSKFVSGIILRLGFPCLHQRAMIDSIFLSLD